MPAVDKPLEHSTCRYCGAGFFHDASRQQLYCKPSHRVAACNTKRAAGERALVVLMGFSAIKAVEFSEKAGSKKLADFLIINGLRYDETAREWVRPVALVTEVKR